ncbi:hypothetical protein [Agriterribacter humi]|jgi:hypothetical protein|nr:hypothetical protein [Agriterribacter humi]
MQRKKTGTESRLLIESSFKQREIAPDDFLLFFFVVRYQNL